MQAVGLAMAYSHVGFYDCRADRTLSMQAIGLARAEEDENTLKGLLMIGHLDVDVEGKQLPWPMPTIGFGNGAHLAFTDLRCSSGTARK